MASRGTSLEREIVAMLIRRNGLGASLELIAEICRERAHDIAWQDVGAATGWERACSRHRE